MDNDFIEIEVRYRGSGIRQRILVENMNELNVPLENLRQAIIHLVQSVRHVAETLYEFRWESSPESYRGTFQLESSPGSPRNADQRAEALLLEHLDERQRADWNIYRRFDVIGKTGHTYRICEGRTGNILVQFQNGSVGRFCLTTENDGLPVADQLLAQKLLIESNEALFFELANGNVLMYPSFFSEHTDMRRAMREYSRGPDGTLIRG